MPLVQNFRLTSLRHRLRLLTGLGLIIVLTGLLRFGVEFFLRSCFIFVVCLCAFGFWLLLSELKKCLDTEQRSVIRLSPGTFTSREVDMLNKVLLGEKYSAIATDTGQAESTLKHKLPLLFKKIGVTDRISFLAGFSRYKLVWQEP